MIKGSMWVFTRETHIFNENGKQAFFVDEAVSFWGGQLSFKDMDGTERAFIAQKRLSFIPQYTIYRDGDPVAEVKKGFAWFRRKLSVETAGPNDYTIDGSFWDHEYVFRCGGSTVAVVSRSVLSLRRTYDVDIVDGEDEVFIPSLCMIIDHVLRREDV